ncbi:precorrin-6A reductase [Komagataeibacter rhaeticus]|uniref:cobalt-precorrin-6A reductase n=1 Tax=Komagataeibacter rhaeticus TaxID=215221 RepID=UPI0004DABBCC|nr:cobalt-precorrin-6A reductase [Komagataeibacter rhaeticus]KDU94798.1 cobalt-precorrin-6X reductase [Komagataeibacter rhaeticus AF1]MBL7240325.1 cobalt-precorrin-6A reductase [Komagataeibacter rhaeticus]PYD55058.1 precorrin-6A reductase [Komagataeibacter rhaeticus]GBQ11972.1 precorrin 6x reductase [Komagataeibacter rhaeticus DSM 16663]
MRVLVLGGTTEARQLYGLLEQQAARFRTTVSLAGVTRAPVLPALDVRIGGFGGAEGLREWLLAHRTDAVVDATHPFATRISGNAVRACMQAHVPLLRVERPGWTPVAGDRWTIVPDMEAAARALGTAPRRVLLTVGRKDLLPFASARPHDWLLRSVDQPDAGLLPPGCRVLLARGPFDEAGEEALLRHERIDVVVTKNSGGSATYAKLAAARRLGVAVIMVARPLVAAAQTVADATAAMAWLDGLHAHGAATLRDV